MDLKDLRDRIDVIDDSMLALIFQRLMISVEIGELKKSNGTLILDEKREKEIHEKIHVKIQELCKECQIDIESELMIAAFHEMYKVILDKSKEIQNNI